MLRFVGFLLFIGLGAIAHPSAVHAQTLDSVISGCTTRGGEGLARQLVEVQLCTNPGIFDRFTPHPNITLSTSRVHPLGTTSTVASIRAAADSTPMTINSAFRTLSEQYMLWASGACGAAARPGRSNHQGGNAIDVANYSGARAALERNGCNWPNISNDPWHFDCTGPDTRIEAVRSFQRLWNHNNPGDPLTEDGLWGPQTRNRLGRSPANGFASNPCDNLPAYGAEFVAQSFPLASQPSPVVAPGQEYAGSITLRNTGNRDWDGNTRLGTTEPRDFMSPLAANDWVNPMRPAQVSGTIAPGGTYEFSFSLRGPAEPGEYCQYFGVVQEGAAWFSDSLGPADNVIQLCLIVDGSIPGQDAGPGVDAGGSTDAGMTDAGMTDAGPAVDGGSGVDADLDSGADSGIEMRPTSSGGCGCSTTSPDSAPSVLILFALVALSIRRRERNL